MVSRQVLNQRRKIRGFVGRILVKTLIMGLLGDGRLLCSHV